MKTQILKSLKDVVKKLRDRQKKQFVHTTYIVDTGSANTMWQPAVNNFQWTNSVQTTGSVLSGMTVQQTAEVARSIDQGSNPKEVRIDKKPIEVVLEVMIDEPKLSINDLEKQIEVVVNRKRVLQAHKVDVRDEEQALRYLYAREMYTRFKKHFPWKITTTELIQKLVDKYNVRTVTFKEYGGNVPNEALDVLESFMKAWSLVIVNHPNLTNSKWEPEVRLVIDYKGYVAQRAQEIAKRRDPILYVSSPFGNWFYVLGAWDKEVEIVDELIYKSASK